MLQLIQSIMTAYHTAVDAVMQYHLRLASFDLLAWIYFVIGVIACAYVIDFLMKENRRNADKNAVHGNARFAERDEIRQYEMLHNGGTKMVLAEYNGQYVGAKEHALVCAPTGAGKGVGIVIPTQLTYRGSIVVNDPKGENLRKTAGWRESQGQEIIVLDPWGVAEGDGGRRTSHYNPLDGIDGKSPKALAEIKRLAEAICGETPLDATALHFYNKSKELIVFYIAYVIFKHQKTPDCNLVKVRQLIRSGATAMLEHMAECQETDDFDGELALQGKALSEENFAEGTFNESFQSVMTNVATALDFLADKSSKDFFGYSDCNLKDLADRKATVYIVVSPADAGIARTFLRIIYTSIITDKLRVEGDKPLPLLVLIDELVQLGRFLIIEETMTIARGYGMRYLLITQNIEQIEKCYGKGAGDIVGNCDRVYFSPASDEMRKKISDALGIKTVTTTSRDSKDRLNHSETGRLLMTPQQVAIEKGVFIFPKNGLPFIGKHIKYYNHKLLAKRANMVFVSEKPEKDPLDVALAAMDD